MAVYCEEGGPQVDGETKPSKAKITMMCVKNEIKIIKWKMHPCRGCQLKKNKKIKKYHMTLAQKSRKIIQNKYIIVFDEYEYAFILTLNCFYPPIKLYF